MQEWAEKERDKAIEVKRMAKQQKLESEKARQEVILQLDSLKKVNHRLLDKNKFYEKETIRLQNEIERLKDKIVKFEDNKRGTDYDNKKKKRGN